jgi:membrane protein DedA with SNARE-associated domain
MPLGRFVTYTGMGAGIWCAILAGIGWYLGNQAQLLDDQAFRHYSTRATLFLIPALMVIIGVYVYFQRRKVDVRS